MVMTSFLMDNSVVQNNYISKNLLQMENENVTHEK